MKVPDEIIRYSFELLSDNPDELREDLHRALRSMCPQMLKANDAATTKAMREAWDPNNPTRFCCYFVSEVVYWYCLKDDGAVPMALVVPGDATLHRFVRVGGIVCDITCDQFEDYSLLDYSKATPKMFMQTGGVGPSKRAKHLASLLLNLEEIKKSFEVLLP